MEKFCPTCGHAVSEKIAEKLGTPIADLGLSSRCFRALTRRNYGMKQGMKYLEEVLGMNRERLLELYNFGPRCLEELTEKLTELGFEIP